VADGVDELEAALSLVEPLGINIYLRGANGCIANRVGGSTFIATGVDTYTTLVMECNNEPVFEAKVDEAPTMVAGDDMQLRNQAELANMIYELIDRGVFLR
jgi:hypothetical protein